MSCLLLEGDGCLGNLCSACTDRLAAEREARERAERERDLAVAHDRQPYPTAAAYEQVCAVLAGTVKELEEAREIIGTRSVPCSECGKEMGSLGRRITAEIGIRRSTESRLAAAEECLRHALAALDEEHGPKDFEPECPVCDAANAIRAFLAGGKTK